MRYLLILSCLLMGCQQNARFLNVPSLTQRPASPLECPAGGLVVVVNGVDNIICSGSAGNDGVNGHDGSDGLNGAPGQNGSSCSAAPMVGGALITCTDGTSAVVLNGQNGAPAIGLSIKEVVHPCGQIGVGAEVFLRLSDDTIIAHYAGTGNTQFLSLLTPGAYQTTGLNGNCNFNVGPAPAYLITH